jgi:8-oxo-dGTP diphosphatase
LRNEIADEVRSISPFDATEESHIVNALRWIESDAPIFRIEKPATPNKHLVSYFACVTEAKVLLVDHRNAGLWLPTGGHVEPNEHPRETVVRELQEELSLAVRNEEVGSPLMITISETVGTTAGHTDVSLWYVLRIDPNARLKFDETEFHDVRWFDFDSIPFDRADPHMRRFVAKLHATR